MTNNIANDISLTIIKERKFKLAERYGEIIPNITHNIGVLINETQNNYEFPKIRTLKLGFEKENKYFDGQYLAKDEKKISSMTKNINKNLSKNYSKSFI